MAEDGAFREDLYYRRGFAAKMGIDVAGVSPQALAMMMTYHWPGNVRELENVIERAVILSESGLIEPGHLPNPDTCRPRCKRLSSLSFSAARLAGVYSVIAGTGRKKSARSLGARFRDGTSRGASLAQQVFYAVAFFEQLV